MSQNRHDFILTFEIKFIKEKTNITKNIKNLVLGALMKEFA